MCSCPYCMSKPVGEGKLLLVSLSSLLNTPRKMHKSKLNQNFYTIGRNNELKETTVKTSEIATNMTDISGKTVVSAEVGKNLWWRFSDGRIKFAWDDNLEALTLHVDGSYIGIISLAK